MLNNLPFLIALGYAIDPIGAPPSNALPPNRMEQREWLATHTTEWVSADGTWISVHARGAARPLPARRPLWHTGYRE